MITVVGMVEMETGGCGTWPRTSLAQTTEANLYNNNVMRKTCMPQCVENERCMQYGNVSALD